MKNLTSEHQSAACAVLSLTVDPQPPETYVNSHSDDSEETPVDSMPVRCPQVLIPDGHDSHNFVEMIDLAIQNQIHITESRSAAKMERSVLGLIVLVLVLRETVQNSVTVEQQWEAQKISLPAKLHKEYLDTQRSPLKFDLHTTVDVNKARSKHKAGLS